MNVYSADGMKIRVSSKDTPGDTGVHFGKRIDSATNIVYISDLDAAFDLESLQSEIKFRINLRHQSTFVCSTILLCVSVLNDAATNLDLILPQLNNVYPGWTIERSADSSQVTLIVPDPYVCKLDEEANLHLIGLEQYTNMPPCTMFTCQPIKRDQICLNVFDENVSFVYRKIGTILIADDSDNTDDQPISSMELFADPTKIIDLAKTITLRPDRSGQSGQSDQYDQSKQLMEQSSARQQNTIKWSDHVISKPFTCPIHLSFTITYNDEHCKIMNPDAVTTVDLTLKATSTMTTIRTKTRLFCAKYAGHMLCMFAVLVVVLLVVGWVKFSVK
jgi:hypothetical protein